MSEGCEFEERRDRAGAGGLARALGLVAGLWLVGATVGCSSLDQPACLSSVDCATGSSCVGGRCVADDALPGDSTDDTADDASRDAVDDGVDDTEDGDGGGVDGGRDATDADSGSDATPDADAGPTFNACGGAAALNSAPGSPCGSCNSGRWACDGTNRVECAGDAGPAAFHPCDASCTPSDGVLGGVCGFCDAGRTTCGEGASFACEEDDAAGNACGGCAALAGEPASSCGRCAVWVCADDAESVTCAIDSGLPGCEDAGFTCADLACGDDGRICEPGEGGENPRCGACLPGLREVDGRCEPDGGVGRTCAEAGCAARNRTCVQASPADDATCGACFEGFTQVDDRCEPPPGVPGGVTASQGTSSAHVDVSWDSVPGATGYHVIRDGVRITASPVTATSYRDLDAPAAGPPSRVTGVSASTHRTSDVFVEWNAATVPNGTSVSYVVRAVVGAVEGDPSPEASGFRAGFPVTAYELQAEGGAWTSVGSARSSTDTSAPTGSVTLNRPEATATPAGQIELAVATPAITQPAARTYRVRARNAAGTSAESEAATGRRATGTPAYLWRWATSEAGTYQNLPGGTSRLASDTGLAPGETRWYRVRVSVAGAAVVDSEAVEGTRRGGSTLGAACTSADVCGVGEWCAGGSGSGRCAPRLFEEESYQLDFAFVPGGTFQQGTADGRENERPYTATISRDF